MQGSGDVAVTQQTPTQQQPAPRDADRRSPYIRPQQGMSLRKSGGVLQVNLENIGGRILVLAERSTHKTRMKTIKPVVNVKPPWGHDERKKRQMAGTPGGNSQQRPGTAGSGSSWSQKRPLRIRDSTRPLDGGTDMSHLEEADAALARDFVSLLGRLDPQDARALADHAVKESEERRLLAGYCGVFPELSDSDSDGEENAIPKTPEVPE